MKWYKVADTEIVALMEFLIQDKGMDADMLHAMLEDILNDKTRLVKRP